MCRPVLNGYFLKNGKNAIYNALYFMPILALLHTIVGGLICKCSAIHNEIDGSILSH